MQTLELNSEIKTINIKTINIKTCKGEIIMEYRKFEDKYIVRIQKNEEIMEQLKILCKKEDIKLGSIEGLGAAKEVEIGLFNTETKEYKTTILNGMFEITSLIGNISTKDGETYLHCHINISDESLNVKGGHLVRAVISATGEIIVTKINGTVDRRLDEEVGLNLFLFE